MSKTSTSPQINSLKKYIEISKSRYDACIESVEHDVAIASPKTTMRLHFLRLDANGEPKVKDLAECLVNHIVEYSLNSTKRAKSQAPNEHSRAFREARRLFRQLKVSGEAGEMLLYFLLESVLEAPQVIAKMDLKTNPKLEFNGSDGVHMRWHEIDQCVDVYFGEAKLEAKLGDAISNAITSINNFHADGLLQHEFGLVTSHFKWADNVRLRKAIVKFVDRQDPETDCRVNHACLIGYDWNEYKRIDAAERKVIVSDFREQYAQEASRFERLLSKHFAEFKHKHLRFEMFFVPFKSVQEFRNEFNAAIG